MDKFSPIQIVAEEGFHVQSFPISDYFSESRGSVPMADLTVENADIVLTEGTEQSDNDLIEITQHFAFEFKNAGFMKDGAITTCEIMPAFEKLANSANVKHFFIPLGKEFFLYTVSTFLHCSVTRFLPCGGKIFLPRTANSAQPTRRIRR